MENILSSKGFINRQNLFHYKKASSLYRSMKLFCFVYINSVKSFKASYLVNNSRRKLNELLLSDLTENFLEKDRSNLAEVEKSIILPFVTEFFIQPQMMEWIKVFRGKTFSLSSHKLVNIKVSCEICLMGEILFLSFKINLFKNDSLFKSKVV